MNQSRSQSKVLVVVLVSLLVALEGELSMKIRHHDGAYHSERLHCSDLFSWIDFVNQHVATRSSNQ